MLAVAVAALLMPASVVVDRGDYVINADVIGSGRPVVAIAGGPGFSGRSVWGIGFGMRERCRTYLFDQLGTGNSKLKDPQAKLDDYVGLHKTIEDLEALRKKAGHTKWTVIGQSFGVIVSLVYAARHPESIDHLVLVSVPGIGPDGGQLTVNLAAKIPKPVMDKMIEFDLRQDLPEEEKLATQVLGGMPYYFHDVERGERLAKEAPEGLFAPRVFKLLQRHILNPTAYRDDLKRLTSFKRPVSMIQGHQDPCGAAMPYLLKEDYFPHAKVHMLGGAGHFAWLEHREFFFHDLHQTLKLPLPQYLRNLGEMEDPARDRELEAMEKFGWPFGRSL